MRNLLVLFYFVTSILHAQDQLKLTLGVNAFSGSHFLEHCASIACGGDYWEEGEYVISGGDPTSRLFYDNIENRSFFVEASGRFSNVDLRGFYMSGSNDSGTLRDQDWYNVEGFNSFYEISDTLSNLSGNSHSALLITGGYQFQFTNLLITPTIGLISFDEGLTARGLIEQMSDYTTAFDIPLGPIDGIGENEIVIKNLAEWSGNLIGIRGTIHASPEFMLEAFYGLANTKIENMDSHVLRDDLGVFPNIKSYGNGQAKILHIDASYSINNQLSLNLGYRYWGFLDPEGITKFGPSFSFSYPEEIETKLGGLYVGLSYLFDINNVE